MRTGDAKHNINSFRPNKAGKKIKEGILNHGPGALIFFILGSLSRFLNLKILPKKFYLFSLFDHAKSMSFRKS